MYVFQVIVLLLYVAVYIGLRKLIAKIEAMAQVLE